jgi:hypothetical protein
MPDEPKYRVIKPGKAFMCSVCGTLYTGANCRNNAILCYESHQTQNLSRQPNVAYDIPEREPGDGIDRPYPSGHYKRVKPGSRHYNRLEMQKARRKWERDREYVQHLMDKLENWPESVTPIQRLAYAFKMRRWESVKQAAVALAYSVAISQRLDELNIPQILRDELKLHEVLKNLLTDEDRVDREQGQNDIDKLADRLRLDMELDDIIRGSEKNDDDDQD